MSIRSAMGLQDDRSFSQSRPWLTTSYDGSTRGMVRGVVSSLLALYYILCFGWGFNFVNNGCSQRLEIWLIVFGTTGFLSVLFNNFFFLYRSSTADDDTNTNSSCRRGYLPWRVMLAVLATIYVVWLYVGAVWIHNSLPSLAVITINNTCPSFLVYFSTFNLATGSLVIVVFLAAPAFLMLS